MTIIPSNDKQDVIELLGGKCSRCGITDHRVLQILSKRKSRPSYARLRSLIQQGSTDYVLLCHNCTIIMKFERRDKSEKTDLHIA